MSEQSPKLLPVDDNVVLRLNERVQISNSNAIIFDASQYLYSSTKELIDKLAKYLLGNFKPQQLLQTGIQAEILEPGKQWKTGKIRCRIVFDFIPDEPENNRITGESASSLDELRKMNL